MKSDLKYSGHGVWWCWGWFWQSSTWCLKEISALAIKYRGLDGVFQNFSTSACPFPLDKQWKSQFLAGLDWIQVQNQVWYGPKHLFNSAWGYSMVGASKISLDVSVLPSPSQQNLFCDSSPVSPDPSTQGASCSFPLGSSCSWSWEIPKPSAIPTLPLEIPFFPSSHYPELIILIIQLFSGMEILPKIPLSVLNSYFRILLLSGISPGKFPLLQQLHAGSCCHFAICSNFWAYPAKNTFLWSWQLLLNIQGFFPSACWIIDYCCSHLSRLFGIWIPLAVLSSCPSKPPNLMNIISSPSADHWNTAEHKPSQSPVQAAPLNLPWIFTGKLFSKSDFLTSSQSWWSRRVRAGDWGKIWRVCLMWDL